MSLDLLAKPYDDFLTAAERVLTVEPIDPSPLIEKSVAVEKSLDNIRKDAALVSQAWTGDAAQAFISVVSKPSGVQAQQPAEVRQLIANVQKAANTAAANVNSIKVSFDGMVQKLSAVPSTNETARQYINQVGVQACGQAYKQIEVYRQIAVAAATRIKQLASHAVQLKKKTAQALAGIVEQYGGKATPHGLLCDTHCPEAEVAAAENLGYKAAVKLNDGSYLLTTTDYAKSQTFGRKVDIDQAVWHPGDISYYHFWVHEQEFGPAYGEVGGYVAGSLTESDPRAGKPGGLGVSGGTIIGGGLSAHAGPVYVNGGFLREQSAGITQSEPGHIVTSGPNDEFNLEVGVGPAAAGMLFDDKSLTVYVSHETSPEVFQGHGFTFEFNSEVRDAIGGTLNAVSKAASD